MQPSFDQAYQVLGIARESRMTLERLQALYGSGLLSDLFKVNHPEKIDRQAFRKLIGFSRVLFKHGVVIGGQEDTNDILKSTPLISSNILINQRNFPIKRRTELVTHVIEVLDPSCAFSPDEGLNLLNEAELEHPSYEDAIQYVNQYGTTTTQEELEGKTTIVFLHTENKRFGYISLACSPKHNQLLVFKANGRFTEDCVLAGIRR